MTGPSGLQKTESLDEFVGGSEQRRRYGEAERPGSPAPIASPAVSQPVSSQTQAPTQVAPRFNRSKATITTQKGPQFFAVDLALTPEEQRWGTKFRETMPLEVGMFYVYSRPQIGSQGMEDTLLPLDVLFISPDGHIAEIVSRAPLAEGSIKSKSPVLAMLELNIGTASRLGIKVGDAVRVDAFADMFLMTKPLLSLATPKSSPLPVRTVRVAVLGDKTKCDIRYQELKMGPGEYQSFKRKCMGEGWDGAQMHQQLNEDRWPNEQVFGGHHQVLPAAKLSAVDAFEATSFAWRDYPRCGFKFVLTNKTANAVRNVKFVVSFYGRDGAIIDSTNGEYRATIHGYTAKTLRSSTVFNPYEYKLPDPEECEVESRAARVEVRMIDYQLAEGNDMFMPRY
jgi:uncharacterized membrane protein (UPF0127 family)